MRLAILLAATLLAGCAQFNALRLPPQPQVAESLPGPDAKPGDPRARAKAHTELGLLYYQGAQMGVALQEAQIAIAADADFAPAYNLLGLIHMYLGENAEAETAFRRALALAPADSDANNHYGWFLCSNGREREGIGHLLTAVKNPLYATPSKPYTNAGLCSLLLKDDTAAEGYFRKAVVADSGNNQAIFHLAQLAFRRGQLDEAKRLIGVVNEQMEPNAESLWLALRIERKLGDRVAEAKYANQLRRGFAGSPQHQALVEGRYE
jgi:type IV pilus assembly protein PilF